MVRKENAFMPYAWSLLCLYTRKQGFFSFFLKIGLAKRKSLSREGNQVSHSRWACEGREKKLSVLHTLYSSELPAFPATGNSYWKVIGNVLNRFNVTPQSRSPFSTSLQTFCLTARTYLNMQKFGLFFSLLCLPTMC